jgi:hypothetical protein
VTDSISDRLLRLPLWPDLTPADVDHVVDSLFEALERERPDAARGAPGLQWSPVDELA